MNKKGFMCRSKEFQATSFNGFLFVVDIHLLTSPTVHVHRRVICVNRKGYMCESKGLCLYIERVVYSNHTFLVYVDRMGCAGRKGGTVTMCSHYVQELASGCWNSDLVSITKSGGNCLAVISFVSLSSA